MPQPWEKYAPVAPPPMAMPQAQPFPGARPLIPAAPERQQQMQIAREGANINQNQDARAAEAAAREAQRLVIAQEEADRKSKAATLTGGVDTTESEKTASFLTTRLQANKQKIDEILEKHPDALQPGWLETIGGAINPRVRDLAISDDLKDARIILNNRYRNSVDAALTLATGAAYTEEQKQAFTEMFSPNVTDTKASMEDKKQQLQETILAGRAKAGAGVIATDQAMAEIDRIYGGKSTPSGETPEQQIERLRQEGATDLPNVASTENKITPYPPGYQQDISEYMSANRGKISPEQLLEFTTEAARKYGVNAKPTDLGTVKEVLDFYNQNPDTPISKTPMKEPERKLSETEGKVAGALDSELGAGTIGFANAMGMGIPQMLMSPENEANFKANRDQYGTGAAIGDIAGSIAPTMAIEQAGKIAATKFAPELLNASRAPLVADMGANAAYGASRGAAGAEDGDSLSEALKNAAYSAGGAALGRTVAGGTRALNKPKTIEALDLMGDTKLTNLQRMGFGKAEEAAGGVPGIRGARQKAAESWNIKNSNAAIADLGHKLPKGVKAGTEANEAVNKILGMEYDTIRPKVVGNFDPVFKNATAALKVQVGTSPLKKQLYGEIAAIEKSFKNGTYDGNIFKDADQRLRALEGDWMQVSAETSTSPSVYHEMGKLAGEFRKRLREQVSRNDPVVGARLKKIDRGWAKQMRNEYASNKAIKSGGVYSPGEHLMAVKHFDSSKNKGLTARGKAPGQKETMAAVDVMGSKPIPETSSLFQTAMAGGLASGGVVASQPLAALVAAGGAMNYLPGVKKLTEIALARRPKMVQGKFTEGSAAAMAEALRRKMNGED